MKNSGGPVYLMEKKEDKSIEFRRASTKNAIENCGYFWVAILKPINSHVLRYFEINLQLFP